MADKEKGRMELEDLRIDLYSQEADEKRKLREQVSLSLGVLYGVFFKGFEYHTVAS
jgi:hypothetical protein